MFYTFSMTTSRSETSNVAETHGGKIHHNIVMLCTVRRRQRFTGGRWGEKKTIRNKSVPGGGGK